MGYLYDEFRNRRQDKSIESIEDFVQLVFDIMRSMQRACEIVVKLGYTCAPKLSGNFKNISTSSGDKPTGDTRSSDKSSTKPKEACYMCGRLEHKTSDGCPLKQHQDVNTDPMLSWTNSEKGIEWAAKGYKFIPLSITKDSKERLASMPQAHSKTKSLAGSSSKNEANQ